MKTEISAVQYRAKYISETQSRVKQNIKNLCLEQR